MGLDFGAKTVGVAISDPLLITAQGIEIIRRKEENKLRRTLARIEELIEVYQIGEIILGLPKHMNDTEGTRVELTKEFAEKLERRTGLPVHLWAEKSTGRGLDLEKIAFTLEGEGTAWFYVLEQTMIGGRHYLLVTEEEEGDCDALILKEIPQEEDTDSIYEIVEEDTELAAVASVFESMLEDIEIEP